MIILDPAFKKDVQTLRTANKAHNDMMDYFIKKLGERAGLKTKEEHEIFWDHVLNEFDLNVEYKKGKSQ